jgi:hypothetical protein
MLDPNLRLLEEAAISSRLFCRRFLSLCAREFAVNNVEAITRHLNTTSRSALPKSTLGPKMIASSLLRRSVFRTEGKPFSSWELLVARTQNRRPFRK